MTRILKVVALVLGLLCLAAAGQVLARLRDPDFDHLKHQRLFPQCQSCHVGAVTPGFAIYPTAESCTACHDGQIEKKVAWEPRSAPLATNLKFSHGQHATEVVARAGRDSTVQCISCHTRNNAPRMEVQHAVVRQCLDCHGQSQSHLALADSACSTCHLTLAEATTLPVERVAAFPVPESHRQPEFVLKGHGRMANAGGSRSPVPSSCATCHARDFCTECHVDALEQRAIQALAVDARSLAHPAKLAAPPSHDRHDFIVRHGADAKQDAMTCRTCHTRESCTACHAVEPRAATALARAGVGRGAGAQIVRKRPATHVADFKENHKSLATASPRTCTACHTRTECLDCHRPNAASVGGYHPAGFLTRHPAAAYAREASCADCHSTTGFCAACHQQSGLVAERTLRPGFHDAKKFFLIGHGQAARQSLETCVGCHTERDCLTCHSAQGGRRFNPHGPGFDADRLKRKNPEMCTACHGVAIP
ncbi:MAG: cytochrome c3 family protein [Gemmatimonadota bacterium]